MSRHPDISQIGREAIFLVAGGRAILLQIAHPRVGAGVAEHSDFAHRALGRLHGTLAYLYALQYGTEDDRRTIIRVVNRAHAPVRGPGYNAFDPELQRWVAATISQSMLELYEGAFGALSAADADEIQRLQAQVGSSLQMPHELWPATRAEFDAYWARSVAELHVTPEARRVARDLLAAAESPWWIRSLMPYVRLVTAGLLPAELRAPFGFRWTPRQQRRFDRTMRATFAVYRLLPRSIRWLPCTLYLRRLRRMA
ncbi:DUF2236 domain-containing protein [Microbacteriaceae bacterium VKM Ac-2855]|nr:DUF2236 domain-containing protein [Microbacteriaceae bacterium VKM Ac-2855]